MTLGFSTESLDSSFLEPRGRGRIRGFRTIFESISYKKGGWGGGGGVETSAENVALLFCSNSVKNFICAGTFVFFRVFLNDCPVDKN